MARRNGGLTEHIMSIAAKLPWWLDVCLAVALYVLLHALATHVVAVPAGTRELGQSAMWTIGKSFAVVLQYLLPALLLIGAVLSVVQRDRRAKFLASVSPGNPATVVGGITWPEFERVIGQVFRQQGFSVKETGGGAGGGVNFILTRNRHTFLVQCKQWRTSHVGARVVRELCALVATEGAAGGYIVTYGRFTEDAKTCAAARNIELIDGEALRPLIRQMRKANPAPEPWATVGVGSIAKGRDAALTCPKCGSAMVKRVANRGANAGAGFWGCAKFPACNGTRAG
jgi:restriction system protein